MFDNIYQQNTLIDGLFVDHKIRIFKSRLLFAIRIIQIIWNCISFLNAQCMINLLFLIIHIHQVSTVRMFEYADIFGYINLHFRTAFVVSYFVDQYLYALWLFSQAQLPLKYKYMKWQGACTTDIHCLIIYI